MLLLINKPIGWTSFDVVNYIRTRIRHRRRGGVPLRREKSGLSGYPDKSIKVGHAGTLDPFATGLLIVAVGREQTKRLNEFKNLPKTYVATLHLGAVSDTYDVTGRIEEVRMKNEELNNNETMEQWNNEMPQKEQIQKTVNSFIVKQFQIPPMYSAKKVAGQRLYKLARQGIEVERTPSEIEIFDIKILRYSWPLLTIEVSCSAGTYIRSLAHDIGQQLGGGAYCEELTRTKIGDYTIKEAQSLDTLVFE